MPLNRHLPTILKVTSSPLDRMTSGHRIRQSFDTSVCDVQRVPVDGQANVVNKRAPRMDNVLTFIPGDCWSLESAEALEGQGWK
ncbi:uncharacterized protein LOC143305696 isoform X2 [Osmia lignaria lignaria]|uniref:uncharacterized protein LOC143305696 isoform X2 n=1 Tax=Osmia lignaria lignaria TaxID=1437193 RepID=UPI00402BD133